MKRLGFIFTLAFSTLIGFSFSTPSTENSSTVNIDPEASEVMWKGYKVTGNHEGTIAIKTGSLEMENDVLTGGTFEIDMTSITCTDLKGQWADKLVGHLSSNDFFGVETFPTAKFVISKVVSRGKPGAYKIIGDLTIKKNTEQIKFNATVNEVDGVMVAEADLTIDRSDFDVRYGSGSFFDNLGDKTIYDEFDLKIKLVTSK